jgi:nucleoid-associated protein YgaU
MVELRFSWERVMNQDKKLGLALGILLIGTVAALFFRNEQELSTEVPQLHDAQEVDEVIDEGFGPRPYPSEPFHGAEISGGPQVSLTDDSENNLDHLPNQPRGSQLFPSTESSEQSARDRELFPLGPPDPVRVSGVEDANQTVPAPVPNRDPNSEWAPTREPEDERDGAIQQPITYRIQAGDTLTELARKFLGSTRRFPEIYDLNRDRMRSPDDLVVGNTIRIPARRAAANTGPTSVPTDANIPRRQTPVQPVSNNGQPADVRSSVEELRASEQTDTGPSVKRFTRASRSPLRPGLRQTPQDKQRIQRSLERRPVQTGQQPADPNNTGRRYYTVRRGDSLEKIAIEQYGNRFAARKIFAANRGRLVSPDALPAGVRITLP